MMNWPDNKRIAVMMAFDLDAETMWTTHGDGSTAHMTNLSRGAYGPKQGVPRILDMLDSHQVKATFFIPGVVAEHYPEVVREIARRGHDIGFHGYLHEESTKTTYEQEDATMHRSEKIIYDLTGQKIAGHRAPGGVIHDYSLRLFLEHGYIYSSNWRDSDGPFLHQIDGKTIPLVELPQVPIIKGDAKSVSIAAASIIAKVTRDRMMAEYEEIYPGYGFASNKGYGSAQHIAALKELGPTPIHRRTFIKNFT